MFKAIIKTKNKFGFEEPPINVYAVEQDSHGYPKFLIHKNNQWVWRSAKHFRPLQ